MVSMTTPGVPLASPHGSRVHRLEGIEALRALAATMIVLYHLVLLPNPDMEIPPYLEFVKTRFGLGVPLFYVLSGFVLAYGYSGKIETRTDLLRFYVRRYFRIAPLFYSMILVWLVYTKIKAGTFNTNVHDFILNVTFLFGFIPGKHESIVAAGWSIGVEIIFYLVFPLIAVVVRDLRSAILALLMAMLLGSDAHRAMTAAGLGSFAYMNLLTHLPHFMAGVVGYMLWKRLDFRRDKRLGCALLLLSVSMAVAIASVPELTQVMSKLKGVSMAMYCWSLIFMLATLSLALWQPYVLVNPLTTRLGTISFSLYLLHPLVIMLMLGVYKKVQDSIESDLLSFGLNSALTMTVVAILSLASFRMIESPGMAYGKKVSSRV